MTSATPVLAAPRRHAPVAINGSPLWPPVTGVQRVARGLTRQLLNEAAPGEVTVVGAPAEFGGRHRGFAGGRGGRIMWEQTGLPLAARHADVVVNLGNLAPMLHRPGAKSLVLTYDLHALRLPGHYRSGWASIYWRMSAAAYRRATFRLTLSRTIAGELERTLGGHVDAVLPPGIDRTFQPAADDAVALLRRRFRLDGPYLAVVGWNQPAKRARLALEAHRRVAPDLPHQLVIVGADRGDFAPVDLGEMPASVVMAGRLSDEELGVLYSGSAGLLFPSGYEGFGLPPVEALACGAPVAVSRIAVLEEVVGDLPGASFVDEATPEAWAEAAVALIAQGDPRVGSQERSRAAHARYPWEGKGRELLGIVGR